MPVIVKLEKAVADALNRMVKIGLFQNKDEAARVAIVKYASDLGILSPAALWSKITGYSGCACFASGMI